MTMLGAPCSQCCQPAIGFAGLALAGWKNSLHSYNTATAAGYNPTLSQGYHTADNQPTFFNSLAAATYTRSINQFGPSCDIFSSSGLQECFPPEITFTTDNVELKIKLRVYYFSSPYTVEVLYRKARASFWENKHASGVFLFTPSDAVSFTSNTSNLSDSDIGTVAVVQLAQGETLNSWSYPLRVEITQGVSPLRSPMDFASSGAVLNTSGFTVRAENLGDIGLRFTARQNFLGDRVLIYVPPIYWHAFAVGQSLAVSGIGVEYLPFPGSVIFGGSNEPEASSVTFTSL